MTTLTATGQLLADRYRLNRWVGGGSMGEVWEATDTRMELTVAVKVLRPANATDPIALERFRIEAKLGARLDHPGIAKVRDVNVDKRAGEPPWMVQEYVDGTPLTELLTHHGALSPARAVAVMSQVADAAQAAHAVGIIHRDLTPRNLLVTRADLVKVTDFGIARADSLAALTTAGQVVGAPAYLSPEQVRGHTATAASDVYTMGVVLYECLAGTRPFDGRNSIEVARAHLDQVPPPLRSSIPGPIRAIASTALAKEPEHRPTAEELARRLRAAVADTTMASAPATTLLPAVRHPAVRAEDRTTGPIQPAQPARHAVRPHGTVSDTVRTWLGRAGERLEPVAHTAGATRQRAISTVRRAVTLLRPALQRGWARGQRAWHRLRPELVAATERTWQYVRLMRVGLVGIAMVLLAVIAVLVSSMG